MDPISLLDRLRRLRRSRPDDGVLHLPTDLTPTQALEADTLANRGVDEGGA